jgi:hypothetical protein
MLDKLTGFLSPIISAGQSIFVMKTGFNFIVNGSNSGQL